MDYVELPLVGRVGEGKFTIVDGDYDGEWFSTLRLWLHPTTGYVYTTVDGERKYLHDIVCPKIGKLWCDHIDRNKLNNRSCNLRRVTPSENSRNSLRVINKLPPEEEKIRKAFLRNLPENKRRKALYDKERYLNKKLKSL